MIMTRVSQTREIIGVARIRWVNAGISWFQLELDI